MNPDKLHAVAQELQVRPASIDQLLAQGIPEQDAMQLLILRGNAQVTFDISKSGVQGVKPPVRDVANAYLLFGGDMAKVGSVVHDFEHEMTHHNTSHAPGIATPCSYVNAQRQVTEGFQRALYSGVLNETIKSAESDTESPLGLAALFVIIVKDHGAHGSPSATRILKDLAEGADRFNAEKSADKAIETAQLLPDQDVYMRTGSNDLIVFSKPDILLEFAKYRPGDTEYLQAIRDSIARNDDTTRAAQRKLALFRLSKSQDDLVDAGMTAFTHAQELLGKKVTLSDKKSKNASLRTTGLFNVLLEVIRERGSEVDPESPEIETLRSLTIRAQELSTSNSWTTQALKNVAKLTHAVQDTENYRKIDENDFLSEFVLHGDEPLEPILDKRIKAFEEMEAKGIGAETGVQIAMDLVEVVRLFNNPEAKEKLLGLNLDIFDKSRQSRICNSLCEALIAHGDFKAATEVTRRMNNDQRRKQFLAKIAMVQTKGEIPG